MLEYINKNKLAWCEVDAYHTPPSPSQEGNRLHRPLRTAQVLPLQGADAKGASVATTADLSAPRSLAREHYEGVCSFKLPRPDFLHRIPLLPSDT